MGKVVKQPHGGALDFIQKGEVRNPTGKKGKSFKKLIKEALRQPKFLEYLEKEVSHKEAMTLLLVKDAADEDQDPNIRMKAALTIMDRIEGTAVNRSENKHKISGFNPDNLTDEDKRKMLEIAEKGETKWV